MRNLPPHISIFSHVDVSVSQHWTINSYHGVPPPPLEFSPPCFSPFWNKGGGGKLDVVRKFWGIFGDGGPPQAEIFEDLGVFYARNTFLNASQQHVFCVQRPRNSPKFSPAAGTDPLGGSRYSQKNRLRRAFGITISFCRACSYR